MRMKHGSDRGPTISMKPRLLAAFTAVAMMFATAVPTLLPQTAYAASDNGGRCVPTTISIGDNISGVTSTDTGVATWVGRDMYIGTKSGNQDDLVSLNNSTSPIGSYAVEAEGLTLVKGKLAINQLKNSWGFVPKNQTQTEYPGFRFGAVGFGAMFRPANGSVALAVNGTNTKITSMNLNGVDGSVGAWNHGGWTGGAAGHWDNENYIYSDNAMGESPYFTALLNGNETTWASNSGRDSIVGKQGNWDTESNWWKKTNPLSNVNGVDYLNYNESNSDFGSTIAKQSEQLSKLQSTATNNAVSSTINSGDIIRQKYNATGNNMKLKFTFNGNNSERLITFTGDNEAAMQVFNLPASLLTDGDTNGVSFAFTGIPVIGQDSNGKAVYASIVVNVVDDQGQPFTGAIDFHTGWHFYWNGVEIGDGYQNGSSHADAYNAAANSIMWNFAKASKVTIRGGQIKENNAFWQPNNTGVSIRSSDPSKSNYITSDDPAAAMLGSIMIPNGSFDDHVTTNGRVWVGADFMMSSPYALLESNTSAGSANRDPQGYWLAGESARTASILDMDMERHNFPWTGSMSSSCAAIAWKKVDDTTSHKPLAGTTFAIYKTLQNAINKENALFTIQDNNFSTGDQDFTDGAFELGNINPNSNYYIRESATVQGYEINDNIYVIETGEGGSTYSEISAVYNGLGNTVDGDDRLLTSGGAIINKPAGTDLEWGKYAEDDETHEGLPGSEWMLTLPDGTQQIVTDNTLKVESVTITRQDGVAVEDPIELQENKSLQLEATIIPEDAVQTVHWSSSATESVIVDDNGRVTVVYAGENPKPVTITATSVSDPSKTASVRIMPKALEVTELNVTPSSTTVTVGGTVQLSATTKPENAPVRWKSSNTNIAKVDETTGLVTGVAEGGPVTITATAGSLEKTVNVTVISNTPAKATTVYVHWSNQSTVNMNYKLGSSGWVKATMSTASCNNSYKQYTIPATNEETVLIYFDNGSDGYLNPGSNTPSEYKQQDGNNVNFKLTTNGTPWYIWGDDGWTANSAPDNCTASRVASAVRNRSAVRMINDASDSRNSDSRESVAVDTPYKDVNPEVGRFKLTNLPDGDYKLQEHTAPEGYYLNPQEYTITIQNGTVTWDPNHVDQDGVAWISDKLTEFSWDKVDAGYSADDTDAKRNPIAGSKWKLEKFKAPATAGANGSYETDIAEIKDCTSDDQSGCATDKDSEAGKFKLTGLALGKYRLVETEAPTGYTKLDTYYYFELSTMDPVNPLPVKWTAGDEDSWDKQTGSYNGTTAKSEKAGEVNAAPNYRSLGDVYWGKVSSELNSENKHVYLGGSAWEVTYTPATGDSGQSVTVQIADCVKSGDKETGTCKADGKDPAWAYDAYPTEGRIGFRDLPWGTYTMKETKAPDGYYADPTAVYTFTVNAGSYENVPIYKSDGTEIDKPHNPEGAQLPEYPNQVVSNEPGVVLPATGGEGNTLIVLFGFALIAISMVGCGVAMRKRI